MACTTNCFFISSPHTWKHRRVFTVRSTIGANRSLKLSNNGFRNRSKMRVRCKHVIGRYVDSNVNPECQRLLPKAILLSTLLYHLPRPPPSSRTRCDGSTPAGSSATLRPHHKQQRARTLRSLGSPASARARHAPKRRAREQREQRRVEPSLSSPPPRTGVSRSTSGDGHRRQRQHRRAATSPPPSAPRPRRSGRRRSRSATPRQNCAPAPFAHAITAAGSASTPTTLGRGCFAPESARSASRCSPATPPSSRPPLMGSSKSSRSLATARRTSHGRIGLAHGATTARWRLPSTRRRGTASGATKRAWRAR